METAERAAAPNAATAAAVKESRVKASQFAVAVALNGHLNLAFKEDDRDEIAETITNINMIAEKFYLSSDWKHRDRDLWVALALGTEPPTES